MNRRGNNKIVKNFKDYLVPIFIVFIILIFIFNYIFSSDDQKEVNTSDNSFLNISLNSSQTEAYIEYSWGKKSKIETDVSLYRWEKLQVVSESVKVSWDDINFNLNKLWELSYNEDKSYTLYSSDLWWEARKSVNIEMRYAKVKASSWSVFSLSQNEVASTIYVASWNIEVQNLALKSTILQKGEKIVIMRNSANDKNSDLSLSKEQIDDYIKNEDWFIKNNWAFYLSKSDEISSQTWLTLSWVSNLTWSSFNYISFNNIFDEAEVSSDKLDIEWVLLDDVVSTININWKNAEINSQNKTFTLKWLTFSSRINDIVYKVYDSNSKLLYKWVITIYYTKWTSSTTWETTSWLAQVQNYPITTSPLYQIITPKQNPYITTENVVRIEWNAPARTVKKIVVNDFVLQKFPQYWTYWQYFANSEFGNLKPWINIYKIQFFGEWDNIVYETNFTIIKEEPKVEIKENTQTWVTQ